jgi:hypothetical protein
MLELIQVKRREDVYHVATQYLFYKAYENVSLSVLNNSINLEADKGMNESKVETGGISVYF